MKHTVKSADLRQMSDERQEAAAKELVRVARGQPNGEVKDLNSQIARFEQKYGISSEQLRRQIATGDREESWEVCRWLMLLDQRDMLGSRAASSR